MMDYDTWLTSGLDDGPSVAEYLETSGWECIGVGRDGEPVWKRKEFGGFRVLPESKAVELQERRDWDAREERC